MATPKKSSTGKKKVLKANCNTSALLQGQQHEQRKKWKRPCPSRHSVKDGRRELGVNGLLSRVVLVFKGHVLI